MHTLTALANIDYEWLCEQCEEVATLYKSLQFVKLEWSDFLHRDTRVAELIAQWWINLSPLDKTKIIRRQINQYREKIDILETCYTAIDNQRKANENNPPH